MLQNRDIVRDECFYCWKPTSTEIRIPKQAVVGFLHIWICHKLDSNLLKSRMTYISSIMELAWWTVMLERKCTFCILSWISQNLLVRHKPLYWLTWELSVGYYLWDNIRDLIMRVYAQKSAWSMHTTFAHWAHVWNSSRWICPQGTAQIHQQLRPCVQNVVVDPWKESLNCDTSQP